jgi:CRP-like cAMP-binding protein
VTKGLDFSLGDRGLNKVLERRAFAKGVLIFEEGHNAREAFVILRGEVEIVARGKSGQLVVLTTLNKGQLFGELALLADSRRTASARAGDDCEILVISQDVLKKKLAVADPLLQFWIGHLADRIFDLSKRVTAHEGQ